jgi:hypothetical protein
LSYRRQHPGERVEPNQVVLGSGAGFDPGAERFTVAGQPHLVREVAQPRGNPVQLADLVGSLECEPSRGLRIEAVEEQPGPGAATASGHRSCAGEHLVETLPVVHGP